MRDGSSYKPFRNAAVRNTPIAVSSSSERLMGWNFINLDATNDHFVRLYNVAAASVVVGTTTPVKTFQVNAGETVVLSGERAGILFGTAMSVAVTTGGADNDTGAPSSDTIIQLDLDPDY